MLTHSSGLSKNDCQLQRTKDLGTAELLEQLPSLQQLLHRLLGCEVSWQGVFTDDVHNSFQE